MYYVQVITDQRIPCHVALQWLTIFIGDETFIQREKLFLNSVSKSEQNKNELKLWKILKTRGIENI